MKYLLKILNNWSIVDVADNLGVKLLSLDFSLHKDVSTQAFFLAFCPLQLLLCLPVFWRSPDY